MLETILLSLILFMLVGIGVALVVVFRRLGTVDLNVRSVYTIASTLNNSVDNNHAELRRIANENGIDWPVPMPRFGHGDFPAGEVIAIASPGPKGSKLGVLLAKKREKDAVLENAQEHVNKQAGQDEG